MLHIHILRWKPLTPHLVPHHNPQRARSTISEVLGYINIVGNPHNTFAVDPHRCITSCVCSSFPPFYKIVGLMTAVWLISPKCWPNNIKGIMEVKQYKGSATRTTVSKDCSLISQGFILKHTISKLRFTFDRIVVVLVYFLELKCIFTKDKVVFGQLKKKSSGSNRLLREKATCLMSKNY